MIGQRSGTPHGTATGWSVSCACSMTANISNMPEESKNAAFYQRFGFKIMEDGVPMQLCSFANKK